MTDQPINVTLGVVAEECFACATHDYVSRHRRGRTNEEAFSACLKATYTQLFHCGNGILHVTCTVSEGSVSPVETYFWKWRRTTSGLYYVIGGTIDL